MQNDNRTKEQRSGRLPLYPPLPLGSRVSPYGKVQAVGLTGGERYYWMVNDDGDVAMMPWFVVEGCIPETVTEHSK